MNKDRLDRTKNLNPLLELYMFPGRILLWLGYMFPKKGYANVRQSARLARSPIMTFIASTFIWYFIYLTYSEYNSINSEFSHPIPDFVDGYTFQTTKRLNLRNKPSLSSEIILTLPENQQISILKVNSKMNWYFIEFNDKTGYVSSQYINRIQSH